MKSLRSPIVLAALTLAVTVSGFHAKADAARRVNSDKWEIVYCVQIASEAIVPPRWETVRCFRSRSQADQWCAQFESSASGQFFMCRVVQTSRRLNRPNLNRLNEALPRLPDGIRQPPGAQPDPSPVDLQVRPGLKDLKIRPGLKDLKIQKPGRKDLLVPSGRNDSQIQPGRNR